VIVQQSYRGQQGRETPPAPPLAYRVPDAARAAGVSESSIVRAIRSGDLVSVKFGGCRVVLHDDLVACLKAGREEVAGS
jgi:hypothetical protein